MATGTAHWWGHGVCGGLVMAVGGACARWGVVGGSLRDFFFFVDNGAGAVRVKRRRPALCHEEGRARRASRSGGEGGRRTVRLPGRAAPEGRCRHAGTAARAPTLAVPHPPPTSPLRR